MTPFQAETVWYFAYGSNMSSSTFRGSRGIEPLAELPAKILGWHLTFEIFGTPYKEPGFASIRPTAAGGVEEEKKTTEVHGVAYLVTREQYVSILASEGGDIVYSEAELAAEPLDPAAAAAVLGGDPASATLKVATLVTGFACTPPRLPSSRYKVFFDPLSQHLSPKMCAADTTGSVQQIMVEGGVEASLPDAYQRYLRQLAFYHPAKSTWRHVGAALFLAIWMPLLAFAESLAKVTGNYDGRGHVPPMVRCIVRAIFLAMWVHHDYLHAPIWGRGDGLDAVPRNDC